MERHDMTTPEEAVEQRLGKVYRKTATIRAKQWLKMGDHEAVEQFDGDKEACDECARFANEHGSIPTLEGTFIVCPGDWIATDTEGDNWAIKPHKFEKTYEEEKWTHTKKSGLRCSMKWQKSFTRLPTTN